MVDIAQGLSNDTKDYIEQLKGKLTADAQAKIQAVTGIDTGNPQVQQGAASALSLAQNGYNPDNPDDSAKLVHAISGGLCLIPGVGLVLGGAVEGLWLVGNAVAKPLGRLLYSIGISGFNPDAPPRETSGGWTASKILKAQHELPPMPRGSFAAFVVPALAEYAAQSSNLKGDMPPATVVDAAVLIWNKTHAGPAVPYYIPAMGAQAGGLGVAPTDFILGSAFQRTTYTNPHTPAAKAGIHPNVYYAFGPAKLGQGDAQVSNVADMKTWKFPFSVPFSLPLVPPVITPTKPRIVMVNTGALIPIPKKTLAFHMGNVGKPAQAPPPQIAPIVPHKDIPSVQSKNVLVTAPVAKTNYLTIAGGAVAGLAIAGPVGAAVGAVLGWGAGKILAK